MSIFLVEVFEEPFFDELRCACLGAFTRSGHRLRTEIAISIEILMGERDTSKYFNVDWHYELESKGSLHIWLIFSLKICLVLGHGGVLDGRLDGLSQTSHSLLVY